LNYCPFTEEGREILQNRIDNETFAVRYEFSVIKLEHKEGQANPTAYYSFIRFAFWKFADEIPRQGTTAGFTPNLLNL
jgi:hypothetical protein